MRKRGRRNDEERKGKEERRDTCRPQPPLSRCRRHSAVTKRARLMGNRVTKSSRRGRRYLEERQNSERRSGVAERRGGVARRSGRAASGVARRSGVAEWRGGAARREEAVAVVKESSGWAVANRRLRLGLGRGAWATA
ncbi:hypothetical protein Cni_G15380 [Canna indica]|uniref:Uncharacterized protein n=1 Tax=Canna indica TaxID=4628 RepID=A0AAQ3QEQ1_9LILI|nr:hypothetical protein Cni_G15380 [Canna indica]